MRGSSHSSMICTSCADQRELEQCTPFSSDICGTTPVFPSMPGKRECGTEVGIARQFVLHCSAQPLLCLQLPSCGEETAHSARINRGGHPHSCSSSWSRRLMSSAFCWNGSLRSPTLSRHGSSCHFARRPVLLLAAVNLDFTDQFAASHDDGVWQCLCRMADALKMVHERHPGVAETMVGALEANEESSSIQAVLRCARVLEDVGFERPSWADLLEGRSPGRASDDEDPCQPRAGWQQKAGSVLEQHRHDHVVWPRLREPEQAMMSHSEVHWPVWAAVHLTLLATTVQFAQRQGCWGAEVGRWSLSWPECAGRAEQESAPTFSCVTWTWHSTTSWMADDWKWWMGCSSTEAPSWPSTQQWCHHCTGMAVPDDAHLPMTGQL